MQEKILGDVFDKVELSCPSSLREHASPMAGYARRRETLAITEHPESLNLTLSLRERE
jgi:hypothetical protein